MGKAISIFGILLAVLMVYVVVESALEWAVGRVLAKKHGNDGVGSRRSLSTRHKRIVFALLVAIAAFFIVVYWNAL